MKRDLSILEYRVSEMIIDGLLAQMETDSPPWRVINQNVDPRDVARSVVAAVRQGIANELTAKTIKGDDLDDWSEGFNSGIQRAKYVVRGAS